MAREETSGSLKNECDGGIRSTQCYLPICDDNSISIAIILSYGHYLTLLRKYAWYRLTEARRCFLLVFTIRWVSTAGAEAVDAVPGRCRHQAAGVGTYRYVALDRNVSVILFRNAVRSNQVWCVSLQLTLFRLLSIAASLYFIHIFWTLPKNFLKLVGTWTMVCIYLLEE